MTDKVKSFFKLIREKFIALSKKQRNIIVFCSIIFVCFLLALIISAVENALSAPAENEIDNYYFFVSCSIFFQNVGDVFMDFFNVNYFVQDMDPYMGSGSSYPPMVLLLAKIFQLIQGDVESTYYIQLTTRGIISLLIYLAIFFVCAWLLLRVYMKRHGISLGFSIMLYAALLLTSPMLFAIDRGNYLLYAFLLVGYFLLYYRSEKRWQRELSYVSLALAVSIKLYPAIFALLLLNKQDWLSLIKTAVYSVILLVLPMFAFSGSFVTNFSNFLSNLLNFESQTEGYYYLGIYFLDGYYNSVSLSGIIVILSSLFSGIDIADLPSSIGTVSKILSIILALFAVAAVFLSDKKWLKIFLITSIMTFVLSTNYEYSLIFFIFPLLVFLTESGAEAVDENSKDGKSKKFYIACGILFTLIFIPLPMGYLIPKHTHSLQHGYPVLNFVQVAAYLSLTVIFIVKAFTKAFKNIRSKRRGKDGAAENKTENVEQEGAA